LTLEDGTDKLSRDVLRSYYSTLRNTPESADLGLCFFQFLPCPS